VYAPERQRTILDRARVDGRVDVTELAEELGVTPETIRRDLTLLERHGHLRRVHGGAIPVERLGFEPAVAAREGVLVAEKERIAKRALEELPAEGAVILDAGTTTARLAEALPLDRELTVVTTGLQVATVLAGRPHVTLHVIGGLIRGRTLAAVGDWTEAALREVYADVVFLGTNGISIRRGLTTADRAEAAAKRAMINAARRRVVLADHTKVGSDHFATFGQLEDVDVVITDTGLDEESAAELEAAGPKVVRA